MLEKELLRELYWDENKSQDKISVLLNVSQSLISYYFKKYNIPIRSKSNSLKGNKNSIGKNLNNKHNWKGEDAGYQAKHIWVRKNKPKPKSCEICGKIGNIELCNIREDHVCTRNIKDYIYVCKSCHQKYEYSKGFR